MIKLFCANCPQPKISEIEELCKQYKAQSNGIGIFPKVPSMIKSFIKQWTANEQIALVEQQIKESFDATYE